MAITRDERRAIEEWVQINIKVAAMETVRTITKEYYAALDMHAKECPTKDMIAVARANREALQSIEYRKLGLREGLVIAAAIFAGLGGNALREIIANYLSR